MSLSNYGWRRTIRRAVNCQDV